MILTQEGKKYLKNRLPERQLESLLKKGPLKIKNAKDKIESFSIALQWCKKYGCVEIEGDRLRLKKNLPKETERVESAISEINRGRKPETGIANILMKRGLAQEEREDIKKRAERFEGKEITNLTEDIIKTGIWKRTTIRPYNVEVPGKRLYHGKRHIIGHYIKKIREIFFDLGFEERDGSLVETGFWNFDALYQPQDHPARDLADTFYMKIPRGAKLPDKKIVSAVGNTHERGIAGSIGWQYKWSEKLAKQPILRTHTTAVSARALNDIEPPAKIFTIGRSFRNETVDYKHLPEFTQIEGIVVDENVGFRDLLGYLKEFYIRMGFEKIRFRPAYFPYTEMSVEPEIFFEERNEWIEMGGSGIFRPEVTVPLGIDVPVLAWGLGLERLIMLKFGINDMRKLYYNDLKLMRGISWL